MSALLLCINSQTSFAGTEDASTNQNNELEIDEILDSSTEAATDNDTSEHEGEEEVSHDADDADLDIKKTQPKQTHANIQSKKIELTAITEQNIPSARTNPIVKSKPTLVSIEQKVAAGLLPSTDKPITTNTPDSKHDPKADSQALAMLQIADNHRNHRTHFSEAESYKEALRLYTEVDTSTLNLSNDTRARAKINIIEMIVWSPFESATAEKKLAALHQFVELTQNKIYSADVRGWAKRHLAKLYLFGDFELEPTQVKGYALSLLTDAISDTEVSLETKTRAMMQLAQHYIHGAFDLAEKEALEKATKLLKEVHDNTNIRPELRAEAKLLRACIVNPYNDLNNKQRLQLLRELITEKKISSSLKAKTKERLAHYYLTNIFDVPVMEARSEAHKLLKELDEDDDLPPKEQLYYYVHLAAHYMRIKLDLPPNASRAAALKMYKALPSKIDLNIEQYYTYKTELAYYFVTNAFRQAPAEAKEEALEIYNELLKNNNLTLIQKANVYWTVASLYINNQLPTDSGANGKTEGLALINKIISDPTTSYEVANQLKLNLAILHQNNALALLPSKAQEEAIRLLTELINDARILAMDKQQIQLRLDAIMKNKITKQS